MGSVVISVEVDPGSAGEPHDDGASDERRDRTLEAWRRASYCFDQREIPATWLVAGDLFAPTEPGRDLSEEDRSGTTSHTFDGRRGDDDVDDHQPTTQGSGDDPNGPDGPDGQPCVHPDQAAPSRLPHDSAGDRRRSARSMPDLIEGIQRSRVGHEIGCLPFSGTTVDELDQDDAVAAVRATFDAAAELGIETDWLRSVAFPDGRVGHRDVLAAYGFECYPEPRSTPSDSLATLLGLLVGRVTRASPPLVEPELDDHGLVAVPTSMSLFPFEGRARRIARAVRGDPVVSLAKRGVDRAAGSDGVFHLSIRLGDLRTEADFDRLTAVLAHIAARRRERALAVDTLGLVARRLGDRVPTPPTPVR